MDTWMWIVVLAAAVLVAAAVTYMLVTRSRSKQLKRRFGPEYDRAVDEGRDRREAEDDLRDLADRRERVETVPLTAEARRRYTMEWESIQTQFVDNPGPAVASADDLIVSVMADRGYPVDDVVERADMVAADHPDVVDHYRKANAVRRSGPGATTEELREAFVHYRALFGRLVADDSSDPDRHTEAPGARGGNRHDESR